MVGASPKYLSLLTLSDSLKMTSFTGIASSRVAETFGNCSSPWLAAARRHSDHKHEPVAKFPGDHGRGTKCQQADLSILQIESNSSDLKNNRTDYSE